MSAVAKHNDNSDTGMLAYYLRLSRERNEELEEEVRLLRASRVPATRFPLEWKLAPAEERLLSALLSMDTLSKESCLTACRSSYDVTSNLSTVTICKLRKKLKAAKSGIVIENIWGRGYRLVNRAELQRRFA